MDLHITRYGTKIAVKDGMFEVTWFDDQQVLQKEVHSPVKIKSLWIQDGALISVAAHLLALEHGIDLVVMDHHGMPQSRMYGFELHTTPAVQKAQVIVSVGPHAVTFVQHWTAHKLQNQADFLEKLKSRRDLGKQQLLEAQATEIRKLRKRVLSLDGKTVRQVAEELRGLEGAAGQVYFQTLSAVLPEEYRFDARSRKPARDPFNSFLNYGYAVLYGKTEQALLLAGISQSKWILQMDLKDFFHSISAQRVKDLFMALPFEFPEDTAHVLARLVTSKNRLPMGAPTSPVLSNMICFEMDHQLDKLAREHGWTYTRYADDLTFSGTKRFSNESIELIRQQIEGNDFILNYEKTALNRIEDEPEVCGLAVKSDGKPDLSQRFVKDLKTDIKIYKALTSDKMIAEEIFSAEALNRFRQHIEGELAFVRFIKGPNHGLYLKMRFMLADGMVGVGEQ